MEETKMNETKIMIEENVADQLVETASEAVCEANKKCGVGTTLVKIGVAVGTAVAGLFAWKKTEGKRDEAKAKRLRKKGWTVEPPVEVVNEEDIKVSDNDFEMNV